MTTQALANADASLEPAALPPNVLARNVLVDDPALEASDLEASDLEASVDVHPERDELASSPATPIASFEAVVSSYEKTATQRLLYGETHDPNELGLRLLAGLGLSAIYGLALGAPSGALITHAIGVPAAMLAVLMIGAPSLFIGLSLFDVSINLRDMMRAHAGAITTIGLTLVGLAPAVALFALTSGPGTATVVGGLGLTIASLLGARRFTNDVTDGAQDSATATMSWLVCAGFLLFTAVLALRVWGYALPIFGGQ